MTRTNQPDSSYHLSPKPHDWAVLWSKLFALTEERIEAITPSLMQSDANAQVACAGAFEASKPGEQCPGEQAEAGRPH